MKTPFIFALALSLTPLTSFAVQRDYLHFEQRRERAIESKRLAMEDSNYQRRDRVPVERMPSSARPCAGTQIR
jgi:hypothetical protein